MQWISRLLGLFLLSTQVYAGNVNFYSVLESMPENSFERIEAGVVRGINLADRTVVISGFTYLLGPATLAKPVEVKLLNSSFASLELLTIGMKVEIRYLLSPTYRIGKTITEVVAIDQY
ncbi:MAG: hypothetical protein KUG79_19210 [Pseudomonadales bacterium]|nr:hypothetical protein [Pseudomonadales bacterium]